MNAVADLFSFWFGPFGRHFLPGVLLPFAVSAMALLCYSSEIRKQAKPVLLCAAINALYVVWQTVPNGWTGGLHLVAAFAFVVLGVWLRDGEKINPVVAYACTWFSLVGVDLAGGYVQLLMTSADPAGQLLLPFYWLGGAGFKDGLFAFPLGVAILSAVVPFIFQRPAPVAAIGHSSP